MKIIDCPTRDVKFFTVPEFLAAKFPPSDYDGASPRLLIFEPDAVRAPLFIFAAHSSKHWQEQADDTPFPPSALIVIAPVSSLSSEDMAEILKGHDAFSVDLNTLTPEARRTLSGIGRATSFVSTGGDRYAN